LNLQRSEENPGLFKWYLGSAGKWMVIPLNVLQFVLMHLHMSESKSNPAIQLHQMMSQGSAFRLLCFFLAKESGKPNSSNYSKIAMLICQ